MGKKEKKQKGYWTKEKCYEEALKYTSKSVFNTKSSGAYRAAKKNSWLSDYVWFTNPRAKWNYDTCYAEAQRYKTRSEFCKKANGAYDAARDNGWLDDYTWFENVYKPSGYWDDYDNCYTEAQKYKTKSDFLQCNGAAYNGAWRNGWLDDYTWLEKVWGKWNYDTCYAEAKKYKTKADFSNNSKTVSEIARKNGWLDDYIWFEKGVDRGEVYWIYAYEDVENKAVYVGLTFRERRHYEHKTDETDTVRLYFDNINKPVPEPRIKMDGLNAEDAQYYEDWYKEKYTEAGWKVLNKAKTGVGVGSLGSGVVKWNYERCKEESLKYKTRPEFYKKSSGAYRAAKKNGWLDDYIWLKKTYGIWTYDTCLQESLKYTSRWKFRLGSSGAYGVSWRNGWLDEFFPKAA